MTDYHKRAASVRYPITERDGVPGRSCRDCSTWKPLTDYYRVSGREVTGHYYMTRCRPCHIAVCTKAKRSRDVDYAWLRDNAERRAMRKRALRYQVPVDVLTEWLKAGCRLCGSHKSLHVDHNHTTGVTRGVLCNLCNVGLGHFREDPGLLRRAIAYLEAVPPSFPAVPKLPPGRRRKVDARERENHTPPAH